MPETDEAEAEVVECVRFGADWGIVNGLEGGQQRQLLDVLQQAARWVEAHPDTGGRLQHGVLDLVDDDGRPILSLYLRRPFP